MIQRRGSGNESTIDAGRLLGADGCALCRERDDAAETWLRWFEIEHHSDPGTLTALGSSSGFCPAHTRRLVALDKPAVLRRPWEFVLRAAIDRVERLIATGRAPALSPCPLCAGADARSRAAADTLIAMLADPHVGEVLKERHGLCHPHLRSLLSRLSPAQAAVAADVVRAELDQDAVTTVAGIDPDAVPRSRLYPLVADHHEPADRPPAQRLADDLNAGSCPCCRQIGRAENTYLTWLVAEDEPGERDLRLCPRHLHDLVQRAGEESRAARARRAAVQAQVEEVAASARPLSGQRRRRRPAHDDVTDRYRRAVANLDGDRTCRVCRSAASAADRCLALIRACADDRHVQAALEGGHGLCLRHGERLTGARGAERFGRRLLTRLRQSAWELNEDTLKQAWALRHEPVGREATSWRRVPTIVDGRAYLGLSEDDLWR
ncbi:hypothetical protein [Actinoallomurus acaciae]|uniref:DUF222 domain-containing protein n=1 Tax=Actinoallomurus acaciae TaxID=502577 RepID=A0ABV5YBH1_9ACTN